MTNDELTARGNAIVAKYQALALEAIGQVFERARVDDLLRQNQDLLRNLNAQGLVHSGVALPDGRYFVSFADPASPVRPVLN